VYFERIIPAYHKNGFFIFYEKIMFKKIFYKYSISRFVSMIKIATQRIREIYAFGLFLRILRFFFSNKKYAVSTPNGPLVL